MGIFARRLRPRCSGQPGHREARRLQAGDQFRLLRVGELDQWWANTAPLRIATPVGDRRLERGDHGVALEDAAYLVEALLQLVRLCALPFVEYPPDRRRIDVGRGADAAGSSMPQPLQQKDLTAREN